MRIIKETSVKEIRITLFEWNQKYLIKYEWGPLEQTYKVDIWDVIDSEDLLQKSLDTNLIDSIRQNFEIMIGLRNNFIS
jgi:hypothetical protein